MLTASQSSSSKKYIFLDGNITNGTVLYTVPTGKSVTGTFSSQSVTYYMRINGFSFYPYSNYGATYQGPMTFGPGTVLSSGGYPVMFVGVEQ